MTNDKTPTATVKKITLRMKLFDKTLPKPEYKSNGAAAVDLYARVETKIPAKGIGYIPLNIALQLPENYWALISARSSLHKRGLMIANGVGVGDYDYCGPNDEYLAAVYNFTNSDVVIKKAERVAQLIVMFREPVEIELADDFDAPNRGGFGTTGKT
ncbi:dUTP diphosphatase [Patescibacteria group bacterium]|nr:dUTP diphosphatase [Patescibacteria group bacterium]